MEEKPTRHLVVDSKGNITESDKPPEGFSEAAATMERAFRGAQRELVMGLTHAVEDDARVIGVILLFDEESKQPVGLDAFATFEPKSEHERSVNIEIALRCTADFVERQRNDGK